MYTALPIPVVNLTSPGKQVLFVSSPKSSQSYRVWQFTQNFVPPLPSHSGAAANGSGISTCTARAACLWVLFYHWNISCVFFVSNRIQKFSDQAMGNANSVRVTAKERMFLSQNLQYYWKKIPQYVFRISHQTFTSKSKKDPCTRVVVNAKVATGAFLVMLTIPWNIVWTSGWALSKHIVPKDKKKP